MKTNLEEKVQAVLIGIMSDGFNRSIGALEKSGAIKTKKLKKEYRGIGSKYYDLVTEELEYTARYSAKTVIEIITTEIDSSKNNCIRD